MPSYPNRPVGNRYYGTGTNAKKYFCTLSATPIIPSEGLDTPEGRVRPVGTINVPLILRAEPVQLNDGRYSRVRYVNGIFAKLVMLFLFLGSIVLGPFAFLVLYPMCFSLGATWMKDIEHTDPISGRRIGKYYRGIQDAPSYYKYHKANGAIEQINFGKEPVLLPDGHTTITRSRIGARTMKYIMYISILLFCLGFILFIIGLPIILFIAFLPCLRDTEHVHPVTGEVVGMHYHYVMIITKGYSYSHSDGRHGTEYTLEFEEPFY